MNGLEDDGTAGQTALVEPAQFGTVKGPAIGLCAQPVFGLKESGQKEAHPQAARATAPLIEGEDGIGNGGEGRAATRAAQSQVVGQTQIQPSVPRHGDLGDITRSIQAGLQGKGLTGGLQDHIGGRALALAHWSQICFGQGSDAQHQGYRRPIGVLEPIDRAHLGRQGAGHAVGCTIRRAKPHIHRVGGQGDGGVGAGLCRGAGQNVEMAVAGGDCLGQGWFGPGQPYKSQGQHDPDECGPTEGSPGDP